jgi:hypothetical protein
MADAACPSAVLEVDNDLANSGYSEEKAQNWVSHNVDACKGTYRYLSQYTGDGSRKGKAIWQPAISVAGVYRVETGYRASVNRTNDADYVLHDDLGGVQKKSVNQQEGNGCTKQVIGDAYCQVGGSCRLVLDGDDGKSDAADVTTFTLLSCDQPEAGAAGPCDGIVAAGHELCAETATTCAGVFTDGSGCIAFCAAAGMDCTARFGGEPGCSKETANVLACADQNGHGSDWCECAYPPGQAGGGGVAGSVALDGACPEDGCWDGSVVINPSGGSGGSASAPRGETIEEDSGCGCRTARQRSVWPLVSVLAFSLFCLRRRGSGLCR